MLPLGKSFATGRQKGVRRKETKGRDRASHKDIQGGVIEE